MADARWGAPQAVLFFGCACELAEARFLKRKMSADDSVEVFRKRYDEFESRLNGEIMQMYEDTVVRVDTETGIDQSREVLHDRVSELMERLGGIKGGVRHKTQSGWACHADSGSLK
jgi:thymidylate kinase